ncbi:urocortin-2 [Phascolarctos cinereus]
MSAGNINKCSRSSVPEQLPSATTPAPTDPELRCTAAAMALRRLQVVTVTLAVVALLFLPPDTCFPLPSAWEVPVPSPDHLGTWRHLANSTGEQWRSIRAPPGRKQRERIPNALDLPFYLLRQLLDRAREERLLSRARNNQRLLGRVG